MAGDDLNSSLIVPLIKRAEPEGQAAHLRCPGRKGDTPIAEELAGELYVFYGFDLPGAFRLLSRRDRARMQLDAGDLRPLAVRNLTRRRARPQIKQAPAAAMFVLDGNLESSHLLVEHLWEQIGPQLPANSATARHARRDRLTGPRRHRRPHPVRGRGMAAIHDSPAHQIATHSARAILAATPRCRAAIDALGSLRARLSRCTRMVDLRRAQGRVQVPGDCEYSALFYVSCPPATGCL